MKFIGIVGSLRKTSYNRKLLEAAGNMLPSDASFEIFNLGSLPLFNADLELSAFPTEVTALKNKIQEADGIIIATPEYNRSISGVLKNAIDWASRPDGDNAWEDKKILVMGAANGALGTAVAQFDLRRILMHLGARMEGKPEITVNFMKQKFTETGELTDEKTKEFLQKGIEQFVRFCA